MVIAALKFVRSGGIFVPEVLFSEAEQSRSPQQRAATSSLLTRREAAVLHLLRLGKSNKVIALELGLSESTVKVYVRNIMLKMGVAHRATPHHSGEDEDGQH